MKVILISDVPKLGKKGDIKDVADGYGRNFLIARGLAVVESSASKKILDQQNQEAAELDQEKRKEANAVKDKLANTSFTFKVKASEGRVSGSVSTKQIEDVLKKQGFNIDKRKIIDNEPLNTLGTHNIKVELYKDIIGIIKVKLVEE